MEATTVPLAADLEDRAHRLRFPKAEIARRAGVTREHLTQVLNGRIKGSDTLLILVSAILDKVEARDATPEAQGA